MPHQVFLSHSSKDFEQATAVCQALESAGLQVWIAPRNIPPGADWPVAIQQGIKSSDSVVLLLSSNSNASDEVYREILLATNHHLRVLDVRIENVLPAERLSYSLAGAQWLDAFEGPLDAYLPTLVDAVQNPKLNSATEASPELDSQAEERAIGDIDWRLAELQNRDGPICAALIDAVLDPTRAHVKPFLAANLQETCYRLYRRAGEGLRKCFDAAPQKELLASPLELRWFIAELEEALSLPDSSPSEIDAKNQRLHRLYTDFVQRTPLRAHQQSVRPITWICVACLMVIAVASLYMAYAHGTMTWSLYFEYPFGAPKNTPAVGPYLEFARTLVLALMAVYLLEVTLGPEYEQLLLRWNRETWRVPWVGVFRVSGAIFFVMMAWAVATYTLLTAPANLVHLAKDMQNQIANNDDYTPAQRTAVAAESREGFVGHLDPYKWYAPYCSVNYVGFGVPMLIVTAFSVVLDARKLIEERNGMYAILSNTRIRVSDVDRAFGRFFQVCFQHTQRYITILAWISGALVFELVVSRKTLAPAGLMYEILASIVVGACTLIWIGILMHFYESAYQKVCAVKRGQDDVIDRWEQSRRTGVFLSKCFFNHVGGVFALLYVIPFMQIFLQF